MRTKFKLLSLSASLLACGLGMSGNAQANAYAFAFDDIRNGVVTVIGGVATPGVSSSQTSTQGTPLPVTRAGDLATGPSLTPVDPLPATQGTPVRINETIGGTPLITGALGYTQFGQTATSYSWADAIIRTEQTVTPGSSISAQNAAEGNIRGNGSATSQASNSSTNALSFTAVLGAPGTINFSFIANPYMEFALGAEALFGSRVNANLDFNVSIRDLSSNLVVFSWSPDGVINAVGGTVGGVELFDTQDLNGSIGTTIAGVSGNFSPSNAFTNFSATSNLLAAGTYDLNVNVNESQAVQLRVPEPGSLALLGLSLAGLAFTRRRKQA